MAGETDFAIGVGTGLTWLTGAAAVRLLWRPASSAFFMAARALRPPSPISGASNGV